MTQHLEPCPFCGGEAFMNNMGAFSCVQCEECGACSGTVKTDALAAEVWNTRTPPKTQAPETEASDTSGLNTLPPQGDLGASGGLIERLRAIDPFSQYEVNPDGPEAAAEIERLQSMIMQDWHAAGLKANPARNMAATTYFEQVEQIERLTAKILEFQHSIVGQNLGETQRTIKALRDQNATITAKLKLAREGLGPISRMHILPDSAMNIATLNAAVRIATQTLKAIGGL